MSFFNVSVTDPKISVNILHYQKYILERFKSYGSVAVICWFLLLRAYVKGPFLIQKYTNLDVNYTVGEMLEKKTF